MGLGPGQQPTRGLITPFKSGREAEGGHQHVCSPSPDRDVKAHMSTGNNIVVLKSWRTLGLFHKSRIKKIPDDGKSEA